MKTETTSLGTYLGYNFVRVTSGYNDYPKHTYPAIVDFYDYDEAKSFADAVNGKVVLLAKKNGHTHYTYKNVMFNGIDVASFTDDNNFVCYTKNGASDFEEFALSFIQSLIEVGTDICYVAELSEKFSNIYNELVEIDDDEMIIINKTNWSVDDTTKQYVTKLSYDSTEYIIAVIDDETDEDVIKNN